MKTIIISKPYLISPDGFAFNPGGEEITMQQIKERYQQQGYYSSNNGRISLDELESHCIWHDQPFKF